MPEAQTAQSSLLIGARSDPGRSGKNNEDALDVFVVDWQDAIKLQEVQVAVVADGIGGNNAGERASKIAIERIRSVMTVERAMPIPERLEQALVAASQDIFTASQYETNLRGMGTTVVAAAIVGSTLYVAHAGDSRAYLVRDGKIHQLTLDHTWAQEALEAGRLTPETARLHPNRNVIKRFLGIEEMVNIDHSLVDIGAGPDEDNPYTASARLDRLPLQPGDRVLLCSDGLNDELSDEEILSGAQKNPPQKAAEHLVGMANAKGGRDNISVILLQVPGTQAVGAKAGAGKGRLVVIGAVAAALLLIGAGAALLLAGGESGDPTMAATAETSALAGPEVTDAAQVEVVIEITATSAPTPSMPLSEVQTLETSALPNETVSPAEAATTEPSSTPVNPTSVALTRVPPTATPTAIPVVATPFSAPTITRASPATPTAPSQNDHQVNLVAPADNESSNGNLQFEWSVVSGNLGSNFSYEVIFWREGQNPQEGRSFLGKTSGKRQDINLGTLASDPSFGPGSYWWGVRLWDNANGKSGELISDQRRITAVSAVLEQPSPPPAPTASCVGELCP